jgi:hypothetical protein
MPKGNTESTGARAPVDINTLSNEELLTLIKSKDEEREDLAKELEIAGNVNQDLQDKLEERTVAAARSKEVFVTFDKKKYLFTAKKFTVPNKDSPEEPSLMTAEEAAKDKELVKKLVESESGLLVEFKDETQKKSK